MSVKDHERSHRTGIAGISTYNLSLTLTSPLPNRVITLRNKVTKRMPSRLLCTCTLGENILTVEQEGHINHDVADVMIISYMFKL